MVVSYNNVVYWMKNPLTEEALRVLRLLNNLGGAAPCLFSQDFSNEAYLVSRQCITDIHNRLIITEKGLDALDFYDTYRTSTS